MTVTKVFEIQADADGYRESENGVFRTSDPRDLVLSESGLLVFNGAEGTYRVTIEFTPRGEERSGG